MILLLSAAVVFSVDQLSKRIIIKRLEGRCLRPIQWLRIRIVRHRPGVPLTVHASLLVACIAVIVSLIETYSPHRPFGPPVALAGIGSAIGGAIGNLYDRARRGAIIDFIDLGWWPVFNVADIAIVVGAVASLVFMSW